MEVINHVAVGDVGGGGFIGEIDRVFQGEIPNGEGFEFSIASFVAAFGLVVELGETSSEFARSGARSGNDDDGFFGFDEGVFAVAFFADDGFDVGWVTFGRGVDVGGDFVIFEFFDEFLDFFLAGIEGDDDTVDFDVFGTEKFDEAEDLGFVGNHAVGADFGLFDGVGVDTEEDFGVVF